VSEAEFASAAGTDSPQGILAIAEVPSRSLATLDLPGRARLLVLDAIQDPGNVGTIVRTAAALGAAATAALPGTVDLWNAKVVRSSMGALFHHPAISCTAAELGTFLRDTGTELWAADAGGETLGGARPPDRLAIALGNEGNGLSSFIAGTASRTVGVPIVAGIESLNVAVSAGIFLYELRL
jgi:TrmH family RNA methyltransferase